MLFKYKAKNQEGEVKEGTTEAVDQIALARSLREDGFFIIDIKAVDGAVDSGGKLKKLTQLDIKQITEKIRGVSLEEKMMFSRNLSVMVASGISLTRGLSVLEKQSQSPTFKFTISQIAQSIKKGISFSEAITKYPKIFDRLYSNMIKVGEATGSLDEALNILANQLEKEHELKSKIKGALTYPIVILIAMTGVGILMMVTVVPQLEQVFTDLDIALPASTNAILLLSKFLQAFWWALLLSIPFVLYGLKKFHDTNQGKKFFSWLFLSTPAFKTLTKKINNARFARNLSALTKGGVPITEALEITSNTLGNVFFRESLHKAKDQVIKGKALHKVLGVYNKLYTPLVLEMLEVGEESGKVSELLERVAEFYEKEVSDTADNMSSIIEPILMIGIGGAVGFFAISIFQPIYGMLGSL